MSYTPDERGPIHVGILADSNPRTDGKLLVAQSDYGRWTVYRILDGLLRTNEEVATYATEQEAELACRALMFPLPEKEPYER